MQIKKKRPRILYVEKPPFVGGSITGLYESICGLIASDKFEPVMLFHGPNPYRTKFEAAGVSTIVLDETPPIPPVPSTRDIAVNLDRYGRWLGDAYRLTKKTYVILKQDRPVANQIGQIIKDQNIDLVHHNNHLPTNRASILAARYAKVPQVCHVRMLTKFDAAERILARFVDKFIYMSTAIESNYQSLGIPKTQGEVIYDPFLVRAIDQNGGVNALRREFGLGDSDFVVSNIGRFDWWKGQDYFIKAMKSVVDSHQNTKALLVGQPDQTSASLQHYQEMQQLVTDLHLSDHVIFTGFRSDIAQIMAASDLIVHSSSEPEPFGRVIVEAMAEQRPVVATAAGGVLDIVNDQITGILVPPKDDQAMAKAILKLVHDRSMSKMMGERGLQDVEARFSVKRHVQKLEAVYDQLLKV